MAFTLSLICPYTSVAEQTFVAASHLKPISCFVVSCYRHLPAPLEWRQIRVLQNEAVSLASVWSISTSKIARLSEPKQG